MSVAIIDYDSGNLHSAAKAFERAAAGRVPIQVTSDPDVVRRADRIVLPGVGAFAECRRGLDAVDGMTEVLQERIIGEGRPFLGICVGAQLMAERGLEKTETPGLGWLEGDVRAIHPTDSSLKIPHMGWNEIYAENAHPILDNIAIGQNGLNAYFVHSYHIEPKLPEHRIATADYGGAVTAIVGRDNMVGTQFHPEKSQTLGLALIANFLTWTP